MPTFLDQIDAAAAEAPSPLDQEIEAAAAEAEAARAAAAEAIAGAAGKALAPLVPEWITRQALTRGGRVGDIAAEVVPAIGGALAGAPGGPGGIAAGGAAGAAAGNSLKQLREIVRGDREKIGAGELAVSTALGAVPLPAAKAGATVLGTVAKTGAMRGAQGGVLAGAGETARQVIDEGEMNLPAIGKAAALGTGVGVVMGAGEGAVVARRILRTPRGAVELPPEATPPLLQAAGEPPVLGVPPQEGAQSPQLPGEPPSAVSGRSGTGKAQGSAPANPADSGGSTEAPGLSTSETTGGTLAPETPVAPAGGDVKPPAPPVPPAAASTAPGSVRELGLLTSAKESPEIHPTLRQTLAGFYEPQSNATTLAEATRRIETASSLQEAKAAVLREASPDAVTQAMGLELVRKFQREGSLDDAADLLYSMAEKAKTQGQAIQILSTLSRATPEGLVLFAQRLFGRKLSPEELARIQGGAQRVAATKEPLVQLARQAQLVDDLYREAQPAKWDEKARALLNLAMLLNPKTIIRNLGGNVVMASTELAADTLTPAVDRGVAIFTGRRSATGPEARAWLEGLAQPGRDFAAGYRQARSEGASRPAAAREGLSTVAVLGKLVATEKMEIANVQRAYRTVFSLPLLRTMEKGLNLVLGAPDRAFYTGRLSASLRSQLRAAGAAVPTAEMLDQASVEAARAIYQDRNFISNALRDAREGLNKVSTAGRSTQIGAGQAIIPFVQVPGALLMRGLEYSPAGFVRALSEAVGPLLPGRAAFNQREFTQAFSRALAGTGGLVAAGYMLGRLGIITSAPEPDPKVRALQRSLGFGEYKLNVSALKRAFQGLNWKTPQELLPGDVLVAYDWLQPVAFPVAMGADYRANELRRSTAVARGKLARTPGETLSALLSGAGSIEAQPLLTGLSGFFSSARSALHGGSGLLEGLAESMANLPGQFLPAAVRQVTQLRDNRIYETRGTDAFETAYLRLAANVPGAATALGFPPRTDVLGDISERYQANGNTYFNVLVNPAFASTLKADREGRELLRLWEQTGNSGPIPGRVDRVISVNGRPKVLTAVETADYQQMVGRLTRDAYRQLMRGDGYLRASDEQRAKVLARFTSAAATVARFELFGDRPRQPDRVDQAMLGLARQEPAP